jgi:hypothetical protein
LPTIHEVRIGIGGSELEGLPGRSGVEEREGEIGTEWEIGGED